MRPETPALLAALASAGLLARRDPRHRPIAALLGARLALAGIRYALAPLIVGKPYHGAARWTWAGDVALAGVAWYAAEAWAVWVVFAPERSRPPKAPRTSEPARATSDQGTSPRTARALKVAPFALIASVAVMWAAYPFLRTLPPWWPLASVALSLAAQLAAVTVAALRRPLPRLSPPVVCAGIVVASTVAEVLAGPWAQLQPWRDWYLAAWCDGAALGGIAAVSAWGWWQLRRGVI